MAYSNNLCAEEYFRQSLYLVVNLGHSIPYLGALAVGIDGGIVEIPSLCAGRSIGKILYSLRSVGEVREYLHTHSRAICHGVGVVSRCERERPEWNSSLLSLGRYVLQVGVKLCPNAVPRYRVVVKRHHSQLHIVDKLRHVVGIRLCAKMLGGYIDGEKVEI